MREKLNSNPMAQLAVIGVLLAAGALMLLKTMGGGEEPASTAPVVVDATATPAAPAAPGAVATTTSTTDPAAAGDPAAAEPTAAVPATGITVPDPPPLPADVKAAYDSGSAVVILIVDPGAPEDRKVETAVRALDVVTSVSVFVAPVKRIANFASITQGVDIDRAPALIVMKPKSESGSGTGNAQAVVRYGFRSPASVVQAVRDAMYDGPAATYSPD